MKKIPQNKNFCKKKKCAKQNRVFLKKNPRNKKNLALPWLRFQKKFTKKNAFFEKIPISLKKILLLCNFIRVEKFRNSVAFFHKKFVAAEAKQKIPIFPKAFFSSVR